MPIESGFSLNLMGVRWGSVQKVEQSERVGSHGGYLTSEPGNHMISLGEPALFVFTGDVFVLSRISQRN